MALRPPATGTEAYLAAILDELRAIRAAVGDGGQDRFTSSLPAADAPERASSQPESATKRTRTRTREGGSRG